MRSHNEYAASSAVIQSKQVLSNPELRPLGAKVPLRVSCHDRMEGQRGRRKVESVFILEIPTEKPPGQSPKGDRSSLSPSTVLLVHRGSICQDDGWDDVCMVLLDEDKLWAPLPWQTWAS